MEQLPKENQNQPKEYRFIIGEEVTDSRICIFVFDKVHQHIIYNAKTKNAVAYIQREYNYIKSYYGRDNCKPPSKLRLSDFT
jgi:hypothetical protein